MAGWRPTRRDPGELRDGRRMKYVAYRLTLSSADQEVLCPQRVPVGLVRVLRGTVDSSVNPPDLHTTVTIRPGVGVLGLLASMNYKPWYALSEFVDNAVASRVAN